MSSWDASNYHYMPTSLPSLYQKDPVPLPRPRMRHEGLTAFLRGFEIGESGIITRKDADNLTPVARTLGRVFTAHVLDAERARVWRVS